MEKFWRKLGFSLGKRWYIVLLGVVLCTAALVPGLNKIKFATGQDSYLNSSSQAAIDNVAFQDAFGGETVILLFNMDEGRDLTDLYTPANIAALRNLETELRQLPEAYAVITPLTSITWSESIANGPGTTALISAAGRDPDPASVALRNADISTSLARLGAVENRELGDPSWAEFLLYGNEGYTVDGTAVTAPAERQIRASLRSTFPRPGVAVGGVVLTGNADLDSLSAGTKATLAAMQNLKLDGVSSITTGSPVYLKEINDYLKTGMVTLGALAIAVMALILIVMFRVRWRLLPLLAVMIGVAWAFAIVGYLHINLSLVTISGLPILIGMGIDFAVQIHNRIEEEVVLDDDSHPIMETAANVGPPLVAATIGAVIAFLALRISKVPMIRDFGLLLAIGIAVLVAVGIVVPLSVLGAREWHRKTATRGAAWSEKVVVKLGSVSTKWVIPIAIASVILVTLGIRMETGTKIQSDPVRWIDQSSQTVKDIKTLEDRTGFATTLGVLIEANNVLSPEVSQLVTDFVFDAETRPAVAVSSSLVGTMAKILDVPGTHRLAPTPEDLQAAYDVAPPDIAKALLRPDKTASQINLRLAPASLEQRAVIVASLKADLAERLAAVKLGSDSVLNVGLSERDAPIRAVPAGLAVVGVGLLENLKANRAELTYLALAGAALFLLLRFRSLSRTVLTLVPVILAVGTSSVIVSALGIELSPLTTVSGPLVIANCVEFAVLITARFLEERAGGLESREATDTAAARTGRAFFTSGAAAIAGFATLIVSPLPLLRDFGLIVTMNIAIALLAALIVMPPLLVWADERGLIGTEVSADKTKSVRLAAPAKGIKYIISLVSAVVVAAVVIAIADGATADEGAASVSSYSAVALPTTTTTIPPTTTTQPGAVVPVIDPATYGTTPPTGIVGSTLFNLLTAQGVAPNKAVCAAEVLLSRVPEADLLASGLATFTDASLVPVIQAGLDCQITQAEIDATITAARGG